jgi:8-oxo-dGTP pyrophosphatase MutT (NUDIX family)
VAAAKKPARTETQISAGGAVVRNGPDGLQVALISTGNPPRWQLPKGLIDKDETPEAAALREVREESGLDARIDHLIEKVEYWYQAVSRGERVRYHKFVYFYLMWYVSGDVADHDHEVNEAKWIPVDDAVRTLAFRSEQAIVEKAALAAKDGEK